MIWRGGKPGQLGRSGKERNIRTQHFEYWSMAEPVVSVGAAKKEVSRAIAASVLDLEINHGHQIRGFL